jgi:hypothetical protein
MTSTETNGKPEISDRVAEIEHDALAVASPPCIVLWGSPVDGFDPIGPFPSHAVATEWAETNLDKDWWVLTLTPPDIKLS